MVLDTGTFIPLVLLPEAAKEIGAVKKIKVGPIEVFEPLIGSYEFNDLLRNLNRYRDRYPEEFGKHKIAGILGLPILTNYLISIKVNTGKVTLRPLESQQRTLNSAIPLAQVQYRFEKGNIWIRVTINGVDGYAHLDTGNPFFHVDSGIDIGEDQIFESYIIGGADLAGHLESVDLRFEEMKKRYSGINFPVISAFGNLAVKTFLITIDPLNNKIYFESLTE